MGKIASGLALFFTRNCPAIRPGREKSMQTNRIPWLPEGMRWLLLFNLLGCTAAGGGESMEMKPVRPSAISGSWYPAGKALATATAVHMMRSAASAPVPPGRPVALVVPHAGWTYSGIAAAAAFRLLHSGDFDRVVLLGPSHYGGFEGFGLDDSSLYRTPLGDIPVDQEAVTHLIKGDRVRRVREAAAPEHCLEIELPFLQVSLGKFKLVPVLAGRTTREDEKAFAKSLAALNDGKTLFVFSTDFIHYGPRFDYTPFGTSAPKVRDRIKESDERAISLISKLDSEGFRSFLEETGATICGRHGLSTLIELIPLIAPGARATILSHYASCDLPGRPDANAVDYVSLAFTMEKGPPAEPLTRVPLATPVTRDAPSIPESTGTQFVRVARAALEAELSGNDCLSREMGAIPDSIDPSRLQAVFVTLKRTDPKEIEHEGSLRGCIGQVEPTYPLEIAVVTSAIKAATEDPRFPPVTARELPRLEVEVTVLSPQVPVPSWKDIRIGTHGIVLEKDGRRALFLPQVAVEQGWTLEATLDALSRKAGLPSGAWREGAYFSVFTGQVFQESRLRSASH